MSAISAASRTIRPVPAQRRHRITKPRSGRPVRRDIGADAVGHRRADERRKRARTCSSSTAYAEAKVANGLAERRLGPRLDHQMLLPRAQAELRQALVACNPDGGILVGALDQ